MRQFIPYRGGQRQSKPRIRSKFGCKNCLTRRIKCDEVQPACGQCLKAKMVCPGPRNERPEKTVAKPDTGASAGSTPGSSETQPSATVSVANSATVSSGTATPASDDSFDFALFRPVKANMYSTDIEGDTLDRFLRRIVPAMGIFFDNRFFLNYIMPATQGSDQILTAALAVTAFHQLPMTDIWAIQMPPKKFQRYHSALEWYSKSVKHSIKSPTNAESLASVRMALLSISMYMGVELRQLNWRTSQGLSSAAFSTIYSARSLMRKSKDFGLLLSILLFMFFTCMCATNSSLIPEQHYKAAYYVGKRLCEDCQVNAIIFRGYGSDFELECKMQSWLGRLDKYESSLPQTFEARVPALRCRFVFVQLQIMWETYLYDQNVDRQSLQARLNRVLGIHEINEGATRTVDNIRRPSWSLETMIIPSCIWIAWYWRSPSVFVRIKRLMDYYRDPNEQDQLRLIEVVLQFAMELASTPYHKPTLVELELFGHKPRVLLHYQVWRYIDHLVWKAGISNGARPTEQNLPQYRQIEVIS